MNAGKWDDGAALPFVMSGVSRAPVSHGVGAGESCPYRTGFTGGNPQRGTVQATVQPTVQPTVRPTVQARLS